ncbi:MAG: phosphate regulon sensor histidine kinase PhoR [Thiobacillaceae bacterium]
MGFWWRPLLALAGFSLMAFFIGVAKGMDVGWIALSLLLALYLLRQLWQESRLASWLEKSVVVPTPAPRDVGLWGDIFYRLEKLYNKHTRSQSELASALEQFQNAAGAVPDGIVILNDEDQIEWCNAASRTYLGIDNKRDSGQYIRYLLRQADFVEFLDARDYSRRMTSRSPLNRETLLTLQLVPFEGGKKLLLVRDVTELERVDAVRRDFVANVSHELRTPLTVVGGFVETLADMEKPSDVDLKRYFALMLGHSRRMQRLLDDLLILSKLECADQPPAEEQISVPTLVQELGREAEQLSQGRHRIEVEVESQAWLKGSLQEIHSAFSNLVSNAVRYTPDGGRITLRWVERDQGGAFSVTDTGEGIAAEHIPRLTERFYRVDRSRSRETGGTGLGLAIVKHILNRHGARLEIQSVLSKGSTFSTLFPAERLIQPQPEAQHEEHPRLRLVK